MRQITVRYLALLAGAKDIYTTYDEELGRVELIKYAQNPDMETLLNKNLS